jgi:uncharacterized protein
MFAKEYLENNDTSYDFKHAKRVAKLAFLISNRENIKDFEVLKRIYVAAILHDIEGHKYPNQKGIVKKYLEKIKYPHTKEVIEIINSIFYTKENLSKPLILNLESKIVQDADRLDDLGAMKLARGFVYYRPKNNEIFKFKTNTGRLIAKDRIKFMNEFVDRFTDENKPF